jgi:hypothetical protein
MHRSPLSAPSSEDLKKSYILGSKNKRQKYVADSGPGRLAEGKRKL